MERKDPNSKDGVTKQKGSNFVVIKQNTSFKF